MNILRGKSIFILSPEAWGKSFVSKHHYASLLAQKGNRVYFVNPPAEQWGKRKLAPNLWVLDYSTGWRKGVQRWPNFLRKWANAGLIRRLYQLAEAEADIIWSFDPFRFQDLRQFGATHRIYHPVDPHICPLEQAVINSAQVLFASSHKIIARFEASGPTPMHFINHGLAQHFLVASPNIDFLPRPERLKVGYVGNLNYPFLDEQALLSIVKQQKEVDFYFIGPYKKGNLSGTERKSLIAQLMELDNCFLLGPKPSAELPAYLDHFDLFLMSYEGDKNPAAMANPHKILEYLSRGKAVVSHFIDEYKERKDWVYMVEDNADLPAKFAWALAHLTEINSEQLQAERKAYAQANSYLAQLHRIDAYLQEI